jgi:hypothetical protein
MSLRDRRPCIAALRMASIVSLASFTACAPADSAGRGANGSVTIDTLPGDIISVSSSAATAWTDSAGWRLVADGSLEGDVGSPGELVNPRDWTVDERGYVYVVDAKPEVIKVYDDRGKFVRTIGGEGAGPGEFRVAFIFVRKGRLVVHDPNASRVSLFDTSGTFVRSWIGACCYWYKPFVATGGRLLIPTAPPDGASRAFLRFDTLGTLLDTLLVPEVPSAERWTFRRGKDAVMSTNIPFTPKGEVALYPDGRVAHGWSGAFQVAVGGEKGRDTTRVFGRAWTPEPLADGRRDASYDFLIKGFAKNLEVDEATMRVQFEKGRIPGTLPAFTGISIDDLGNTWVHVDEDSTRTRFDVFDTSGVYLGPVSAPLQVRAFQAAWGRDFMYVRQDTDEGYPRIVRFRIERRPWQPQ